MENIRGLNSHGPAIVATAVLFSVLTTTAVILRFVSRRLIKARYGIDDWLLLPALLLFLVAEALMISGDLEGRKASSTDDPEYQKYMQFSYIWSTFFWPTIALSQISLLFLYRRLFPISSFRRLSLALIVICACWAVVASIIEIGYPADPISFFFPGSASGTWQLDYLSFWFAMSLIELVIDVIMLIMPIREAIYLRLSRKKKFFLLLIFLLGGFAIITGIVRIATLYVPGASNIDLTEGDIWFNTHLGTTIICACLPTLRPVVMKCSSALQRHNASTANSTGMPYTNERHRSNVRRHSSFGASLLKGEWDFEVIVEPDKAMSVERQVTFTLKDSKDHTSHIEVTEVTEMAKLGDTIV